jgi:hypothetical protein
MVRTTFHRRVPVLLVALLAGLSLWARCAQIDASLPYPRQADESFITARASRILTQNGYDPGWFRYPSLPIYLTSAAMALGFVQSAQNGEVTTPADIGSVGSPFYTHRAVVAPARHLFAVASVVAMVIYALIAARLLRQPWLAPLVLAVLGTSSLYFELSWTYLNVDILAALATALALLGAVHLLDASGGPWRGWAPGILAGLAASCKYNCALVLSAVIVALALGSERQKRPAAISVAACGALLGFLIGTPYALLNLRQFLTDVGFEAHHYMVGHVGFSGEPGILQFLTYTRDLVQSFGLTTVPFAFLGVGVLLRANLRGACVLLTFPFILLLFLSRFRVQFARNALPLHGVYAILVALGLGTAATWGARHALRWWAARRGPPGASVRPLSIAVGATLLFALTANWMGLRSQLHVQGDSRVRGGAWLRGRLPPGSVVLVPSELGFAPEDLTGVHNQVVSVLSFSNAADLKAAATQVGATHVLWPQWGRDPRFGGHPEFERAEALALDGQAQVRFGKQPVVVNYPAATVPWGDPAYAVVALTR